MGAIHIGTSGYSYDEWVGPYYPEGTRSADFLAYYARDFAITELNFSYYRMPSQQILARLADKTPESFRFVLKAHRSLTHDRSSSWRDDAARFVDAAAALWTTGRLAGVLLQFPFSFHYTRENRRYLGALCGELAGRLGDGGGPRDPRAGAGAGDDGAGPKRPPGAPLFLEYRNAEWQRESVYDEMRERGIALVVTDMPELRGLPGTRPVVTSDRAYLRFHGRNAKQWWEGDNRSRYDYLYSEQELGTWVEPIRSIADQVAELIVMFNNHANAQAVINAKQLIGML
jgi:uncharacterized protein YecE (DUF72 family)